MGGRNEFADHVRELLSALGDVEVKPMFGGFGVYRQGLMFALISEDTLYLKTDEINRGGFEAQALERFTYLRQGKELSLSYHRAPEEALEDPAALLPWARGAFEAAQRAKRTGRKGRRGSRAQTPAAKSQRTG